MKTYDLTPKRTSVKDTYVITISGFDGSDSIAPEATFVWPRQLPLTLGKQMVMIPHEVFLELCRHAGHATGITING